MIQKFSNHENIIILLLIDHISHFVILRFVHAFLGKLDISFTFPIS
jgi:hypothetical protein